MKAMLHTFAFLALSATLLNALPAPIDEAEMAEQQIYDFVEEDYYPATAAEEEALAEYQDLGADEAVAETQGYPIAETQSFPGYFRRGNFGVNGLFGTGGLALRTTRRSRIPRYLGPLGGHGYFRNNIRTRFVGPLGGRSRYFNPYLDSNGLNGNGGLIG